MHIKLQLLWKLTLLVSFIKLLVFLFLLRYIYIHANKSDRFIIYIIDCRIKSAGTINGITKK